MAVAKLTPIQIELLVCLFYHKGGVNLSSSEYGYAANTIRSLEGKGLIKPVVEVLNNYELTDQGIQAIIDSNVLTQAA